MIFCFLKRFLVVTTCFLLSLCSIQANDIIITPQSAFPAGANNGSITVEINANVPPYFFYWEGPSVDDNNRNNQNLSNLSPGEYCVVITNGEGCIAEGCVMIYDCTPLFVWVADKGKTCPGGNTGWLEVEVSPGNGTPPFNYAWSNGETTARIENLAAGSYTVTVMDARQLSDECKMSLEATVEEGQLYIADYVDYELPCSGEETGSLTVVPIRGLPPYTFRWSNGSTMATAENLGAGWYDVSITDANGCRQEESVSLLEKELIIEASVHHLCSDEEDTNEGEIEIEVRGTGTDPHTYLWSTGATTADISDLYAGTYTLTLSDADGCTETADFSISEKEITISAQLQHPACEGSDSQASGSIQLQIDGTATPPFSYQWSNGATTAAIDQLTAGVYDITVIDADGCEQTRFFALEAEGRPVITRIDIDPSFCSGGFGGELGKAFVFWNRNIVWAPSIEFFSHSGNEMILHNGHGIEALPGIYTVTLTDEDTGCSTSKTFEIDDRSDFAVDLRIIEEPSCPCCLDGKVEITIEGGIGPFQLITQYPYVNIAPLPGRVYLLEGIGLNTEIYIADLYIDEFSWHTCSRTQVNIFPEQESDISISLESINHQGENGENASIDISVSGTHPPFTYSWDCGEVTTQDLIDFDHPDFSGTIPPLPEFVTCGVTVTDAAGCTRTENFRIYDAEKLVDFVCPDITEDFFNNQEWRTHITPCIPGTTFGAIDIYRKGEPPYTFQWTGPNGFTADTEDIQGLTEEGEYTLVFTDAAYRTCSQSYYLTCDCSGHYAEFKDDLCDAGGNAGLVELKRVSTPLHNPYLIEFSTGQTGLFWAFNNGTEFNTIYGEIKVDNIPGGTTVCARVTDARGCKDLQCFEIFYGDQCLYSIDNQLPRDADREIGDPFQDNIDFDQLFYQLNTDYGLSEGDFIARCRSYEVCPRDWTYGPILFEPYDPDNPCTGGGLLRCNLCGDEGNEFWMDVPPNYIAEQILIDGECMCLFPPGIITDDDFFEATTAGNVNAAGSFPVLAFYDCHTSGIPGGGNGTPVGPGSCDAVAPECEACDFEVVPGECAYAVYCEEHDAGEPPVATIDGDSWTCVSFKMDNCILYDQCLINHCIGLDKPLMDCTGGCPEADVNFFLPLSGQIDCGEDELCDCEEIAAKLFLCLPCENSGGGIAFNDVPNSEDRKTSTKELIRNLKADVIDEELLKVYPNPFNDQINIEIESTKEQYVEVIIYDILGKMVQQRNLQLHKGNNYFLMDSWEKEHAGIYEIVTRYNSGKRLSKRVIYLGKN